MLYFNKKIKGSNKTYEAKGCLSSLEILIIVSILIFAMYLLTPRYWEPGGESWKEWVAARILKETHRFPALPLGPLYVAYLQLFGFFKYPLSMQLEYVITHLFVYLSLFFMLRKFIANRYALLITIAWIPTIATIESGGAVAGMGLFCLYLMSSPSSFRNKEYFPPALIGAILSSMLFLPFLLGHFLAVLMKRWQKREIFHSFSDLLNKEHIFSLLLKTGIIVLVLLVAIFPSHRLDNKRMSIDTAYSPVPLDNHFTIGFFQVGTWKYVIRNAPEPLWIYQDWYFTKEKIYGDAKTIFQAFLNNPKTFIRNILENIISAVQLPMYFFTGIFANSFPALLVIPLMIICWILALIGLAGMIRRFGSLGLQYLLVSLILSAVIVVCLLLLIWLSKRYVVPPLLPVFLLVISQFGDGIKYLLKTKLKKNVTKYTNFIILVSVVLVLLTYPYPHGKAAQVEAVLKNKAFLSRAEPVSMVIAHNEIFKSLDKKTKVLSLEGAWIKSFTTADLDNVYNVFSLPPFEDASGETERFLDGLDVILVSSRWSTEKPSVSTQSFLRYKLHVKPFLEKRLPSSWTSQSVEGYGEIYRRIIPNK